MLENVRGFATARFDAYRRELMSAIEGLGFRCTWRLLYSSHFGVPQLRPRFVLIALRHEFIPYFTWDFEPAQPKSVGECLVDLMAEDGWCGAMKWAERAARIAPTIVGGSKKHGGPDLGPTRARREWQLLGINGLGIADGPPKATDPEDFVPKLTLRMVARLQGFPDDWKFAGKKTSAYRQVGNAFPPPVAEGVGALLRNALQKATDVNPTQLSLQSPLTEAV